jgi:mannose-6-phosphate isomerase-like protein (cupin superfamily)
MAVQISTDGWREVAEKVSFYDYFLQQENIPVYRGFYIEDITTIELGDWKRLGGRGAYLSLANQQLFDAYVAEIPPGGALNTEHHLFEKLVYVLSGRGSTQVWQPDDERRHTFEWSEGSLFGIPLNAHHRFFNGSGTEPARLLAATTAPGELNRYHNLDFVFDNPFILRDRFSADQEDYFTSEGRQWRPRRREVNFVPNVRTLNLDIWNEKGVGARHMGFTMADGWYGCHVHELSPVTYVQAHRHGAGAVILILEGSGYEVMWNQGQPKQRLELRRNTVVSPGFMMYHQHMNPNPEPLRQLAFRGSQPSKYGAGMGGPEAHMTELVRYEDEDPAVRDEFYEECRKRGQDPVLMPVPQGRG